LHQYPGPGFEGVALLIVDHQSQAIVAILQGGDIPNCQQATVHRDIHRAGHRTPTDWIQAFTILHDIVVKGSYRGTAHDRYLAGDVLTGQRLKDGDLGWAGMKRAELGGWQGQVVLLGPIQPFLPR
jgi:hypothetical protein